MQIQFHTSDGLSYLLAIPKQPKGPPLVLVHGAYNDAWIWSKTFMPWFAAKGRPTYALFLKDPDTVSQWTTLFRYSLRDYERHLANMINRLDEPPVLVGHSMGGLLVQRYIGKHPTSVRGACLLASLPASGLRRTLWDMVKHPKRLLKFTLLTFNPRLAEKGRPPSGLLSPQAEPSHRYFLGKHLVRESAHAMANCLFPGLNIAAIKGVDLRIMGAGLDSLALPADVVRTAQLYGKAPIMYPNMGHFMMLEPKWEELAGQILELG